MKRTVMSNVSQKPFGTVRSGITVGVFLLCVIIGCSDHRMEVEEFLEMQEQARKSCATTQPCKKAADKVAIDRELGPYKVGPSDVLTITLITALDQTTLSPPIQVRVDQKGEIRLPLVGTIKVGGLEMHEVDTAIRTAYVPKVYRDMSIFVDVVRPELTNVLVTGAVVNAGLVPLRRTERDLLRAIVGAGGVTEMASGKVTLRRLRHPGNELTLNLGCPDDVRAALALAPLENGDMITVHAAVPNIIFVGGLVNAPQAQSYPPGVEITVLQAIAGSGGLRTDLTPREATLVRRMPDGKDLHVKLNLDKISKGESPNLTLAAADILCVPFTVQTFIEDWINQHIYIRGGAAASVNYNVNGIEYLNRRSQQAGQYNNGSSDYQNTYDPLGFLNRNTALQNLTARPVTTGQ